MRIRAYLDGGPAGHRHSVDVDVSPGDPDLGFRDLLPGRLAVYRHTGSGRRYEQKRKGHTYKVSTLPVFEWIGWLTK